MTVLGRELAKELADPRFWLMDWLNVPIADLLGRDLHLMGTMPRMLGTLGDAVYDSLGELAGE